MVVLLKIAIVYVIISLFVKCIFIIITVIDETDYAHEDNWFVRPQEVNLHVIGRVITFILTLELIYIGKVTKWLFTGGLINWLLKENDEYDEY